MHGLVQSQAVTVAAQELSAAKSALAAGKPGADELVTAMKVNYQKALQEYIDPFKVKYNWD